MGPESEDCGTGGSQKEDTHFAPPGLCVRASFPLLTQVVKNNLSPCWQPFRISLQSLCSCDPEKGIRVSVCPTAAICGAPGGLNWAGQRRGCVGFGSPGPQDSKVGGGKVQQPRGQKDPPVPASWWGWGWGAAFPPVKMGSHLTDKRNLEVPGSPVSQTQVAPSKPFSSQPQPHIRYCERRPTIQGCCAVLRSHV